MSDMFVRTGELKDLRSYPKWAQELVEACEPAKRRVLEHPIWGMMREGTLPEESMSRFILSAWQVIEQFPQYMAMSLLKARYGTNRGQHLARRWLVRNIRVEQNHADYWLDWAEAVGVPRSKVLADKPSAEACVLSNWCWHACDSESLAASMVTTNFAVEGITGEWALLVTQEDIYAYGFDARIRAKAMRWLKLHAEYDDTHPWEALDIVCSLIGTHPSDDVTDKLTACVRNTYTYKFMALQYCMEGAQATVLQRAAAA